MTAAMDRLGAHIYEKPVMTLAKSSAGIAQLISDIPKRCYVGGRWCGASDGSTLAVEDPATGEVLTDVANATVEDARSAIDAAAKALPLWAVTAPRIRSEMLRRAYELMRERAESLSVLVVLENGKSLGDARSEISYAAEFFRWYSEEAVRNRGDITLAPSGSNRIVVLNQPVGVSALITPWNFPAAMLTRKIGPALAAGCTVVCKPASETPLTALAIAQLLEDAGIPEGVVNVLPSDRPSAIASVLLEDRRVRKLSFTGSTEVGQVLLRSAASNVVSCSMELGGNAPFVVFDDADIDSAIAGAVLAKMRNGGEACTAANRFYVQNEIADRFAAGLAELMANLRMGPGLETATDYGPLINLAGRTKVATLVEDAMAAGATLLTGGEVPPGCGWFYPATVISRVPPSAAILRAEIFGPVAPIVTFGDEQEAIEMANDTDLGLSSYVYTSDMARGLRVCEALESGMVALNRGLVSDPAAPFGGIKESGLGREGGSEGMREYLEPKYIACRW